MKKLLIYASVLCAISATLIITSRPASASDDNGTLPHVDGNYQFPQTKWSNVRHTLRIHIPKNSQSVSQISIIVPKTVRWSNKVNDITVTPNNGQKLNANISINEKTIILAFNEPVSSNSKLEINIKNVKQPLHGNGPIYRLFVKSINSSVDMPIGMARFRVNSN
ncbi:hypothetical protein NIES4071_100970 (plasmid) [Calothrix sp. NIES-4071]|nr:hypothetical protein NIES4071_100970 [Calothrix sp. NIES-4071]BAZ64478.1 hypothetical protein NIES4105_102110 [Calothrix sp. NIES-4105]